MEPSPRCMWLPTSLRREPGGRVYGGAGGFWYPGQGPQVCGCCLLTVESGMEI